MDRKYGYFSEDGKRYNIITPNIPRNWYNYIWNDRYITFTSQVGAGESFLQDALGRRIGLIKDRSFFIHEGDKPYGICGLPVNEERDEYLCVHQRGASCFAGPALAAYKGSSCSHHLVFYYTSPVFAGQHKCPKIIKLSLHFILSLPRAVIII